MSCDLCDVKDRLKGVEDTIGEIVELLQKHFPNEFAEVPQIPTQPDVEKLFEALKTAYPERFAPKVQAAQERKIEEEFVDG